MITVNIFWTDFMTDLNIVMLLLNTLSIMVTGGTSQND